MTNYAMILVCDLESVPKNLNGQVQLRARARACSLAGWGSWLNLKSFELEKQPGS